MLKNYQQFLKENMNESIQYSDLMDDVYEYLSDLVGKDGSMGASFSAFAKGLGKDIIDKIPYYVEQLNKKFGGDKIKNIADTLIKEGDTLGYRNSGGIMDMVLYNYNKRFPLGGYEIADIDTSIKYAYGWHNTKYGKLAVEQAFNSKQDYIKSTLEDIGEQMRIIGMPENFCHKNICFYSDVGSLEQNYDELVESIFHGDPAENIPGKIVDSAKRGDDNYYIFEVNIDEMEANTKDYLEFFFKLIKKDGKAASLFDLKEVIDFENLTEKEKNLIRSYKGLNKFNI